MGEDGKEGGTVGSGSLSRRQPIKFQRINVDFRAVYRSDCLFFAFQTLVGHAKRHGYVDLTTNSITPRSFGTFNSEGCTIDSSHVLETLLLRNTTIIADLEQPVLLIFFFFLSFVLCWSSTGSISVEKRCNCSYVVDFGECKVWRMVFLLLIVKNDF